MTSNSQGLLGRERPLWHTRILHSVPLVCTISLLLMVQLVAAAAPSANNPFQWAVLDEKTLYVADINLYSLDLTKTFNDTNPPWATLAAGPNSFVQAMAVTSDNSQLVLWDTGSFLVATYTIATNKWQNKTVSVSSVSTDIFGATNPDTNIFYIVNGYSSGASVGMAAYDATKGTYSYVATPSVPASLSSFSAVWSTLRKSMLVYGGVMTQGGELCHCFDFL